MRPRLATTPTIHLPLPQTVSDSALITPLVSAPETNKHAHPQRPVLDTAGPLMSPVTPGADLPAPLHVASHNQPQDQPPPQADIPPTSLPSPVLSASPSAGPDIPHPLATAGTPRPTGTSLSENDQNETSTPVQEPDVTPLAQPSPRTTSTPPTNQNVQSNTQSPHPHELHDPRQQPTVSSHQSQTTTSNPTPANTPRREWWLGWQPHLNILLQIGERSTASVNARTLLLQKAFVYQDHFYLVLHQIHCGWVASGHQDFPEFRSTDIRRGFMKLNELLTDNALIPHDVMSRFVAFPQKYESLMDAYWYRMDFNLLVRLLPRLPHHFVQLVDRINQGFYYQRGYPPLAIELGADLQVTSPVLLTVIFTSTCRHLYHDRYLSSLHALFEKDLVMNHADSASFRHVLIDHFRHIPMKLFDPASPFQPAQARPPSAMPFQLATTVASTPPAPVLPSQMNLPTIPQTLATASVSRNSQSPQLQRSGHMHYSNGQPRPSSMQHLVNTPPHSQFVPHLSQTFQIRQSHQSQMGQVNQAHQATHASTRRVASVSNMSFLQQGVPHASFHAPQSLAQSTAQHQPYMQFNSNSPQQMSQMGHPQLPSPVPAYYGPQIPHPQPVQQQSVASVPTINTPVVPSVPQRSSRQPSAAFLPPLGYRVPQLVRPNPMRLSLHQVDLRDPIKKLVHWDSNEMAEKDLFFYMNGFAMPPKFLDVEETSCNWNFQVSAMDLQRATRLVKCNSGKRPTIWYQEGCLSLRLRAIALGNLNKDKVYDTWPIANTTWPSVFYIHVNGTELFVRRKAHNGKDLPLDITQYLKEGKNTLSLHFLLEPGECKKIRYVFGIERMETQGFDKVRLQACFSPARDTLSKIQKRLCPIVDDDELAVVSDSLTVGLIDPFMAQVYNVPARSVHCEHLECFDIDTFIHTRKSESGPSRMNDNWQCPICNADARPMHLLIDEYFVNVREKLIAGNKLEGTVAIDVQADGSWTSKVVTDEHDKDVPGTMSAKRKATSPLDREASRPKQDPSPPFATANTERTVIEID